MRLLHQINQKGRISTRASVTTLTVQRKVGLVASARDHHQYQLQSSSTIHTRYPFVLLDQYNTQSPNTQQRFSSSIVHSVIAIDTTTKTESRQSSVTLPLQLPSFLLVSHPTRSSARTFRSSLFDHRTGRIRSDICTAGTRGLSTIHTGVVGGLKPVAGSRGILSTEGKMSVSEGMKKMGSGVEMRRRQASTRSDGGEGPTPSTSKQTTTTASSSAASSLSNGPTPPTSTSTESFTPSSQSHSHSNAHSHDHSHSHSHSHSHTGLFHAHNHSSGEGAEQIMDALKGGVGGKGDRGSRITLIGLGSNVALTGMKAVAGLWLNSASLLAEAGHSLSDMLGDFVTLACWRISRRPPSDTYPWGYGKFETFGTLSVSLILVGGAVGIGLHSYHLLLQVLIPFLEHTDPSNPFHAIVPYLPQGVPSPLLELFHSHAHTEIGEISSELGDAAIGHGHSHGSEVGGHEGSGLVSPHAAWFALISVIVKEWLYRATKKVAVDMHSPVLDANALHHRSDALTSGVALISILLSSLPSSAFGGLPIPNGIFDPLGGLFVSFFILKQGMGMSKSAFLELLDKGVEEEVRIGVAGLVREMRDSVGLEGLKGVRNVRGVKSGGLIFMDLTLSIDPHLTVLESHEIERLVRNAVLDKNRQVRELKVHLHPWDPSEEVEEDLVHDHELSEAKKNRVVTSDFGRDGC